ncbi:MAG: hypothetical protein KIC66_05480 [Clostridium sp.]|uniref:Uncharacterized protein n=1 Tax=Clostridium paraputrificum TaxID=29363 RepID=A0A6N2ZWW3_9CLOT|nr:hypothetical protein [Clostridium sp.]MBS5926525.1 hypothetical protein [Clostridium sp.]MBS5985458.1 hypothetical protein [Clostridium sp.]
MKILLISIIFVMIAINISLYIYLRKVSKRVRESEEENEVMSKKAMKLTIISMVCSFITIIVVSILAILNIWA